MTTIVGLCPRCGWFVPDDCTCRGRRPRPQGLPKADRQPPPKRKPRGAITRSRR